MTTDDVNGYRTGLGRRGTAGYVVVSLVRRLVAVLYLHIKARFAGHAGKLCTGYHATQTNASIYLLYISSRT